MPFRWYAVLLTLLCCWGSSLANAWSLSDQQGKSYQQNASHGAWVLVNFWAPWCPSCLAEMPSLVRMQQQRPHVLRIIGVAVMYRSRQSVEEVVQKMHVNYPIVMGNEDIASEFGSIRGLPTSFLYAPNGKLMATYSGRVPISVVEQQLPSSLKRNGLTEGKK